MAVTDSDDFDWVEQVPTPTATTTTLVLLGRTGNGKSATGNSILGKNVFVSRMKASSVTTTCELHSMTTPDGRTIRVVDTPGLFEASLSEETSKNEIAKCLDLAKDAVHGFLFVLSVGNRFTLEELEVVKTLQRLFGENMAQYMIVVFTAGDKLEDDEMTLEGFLSEGPPELKDLCVRCGSRKILFNNKTKDEGVKKKQAAELLSVVDDMVADNGGKPYTSEIFQEAQRLLKMSENDDKRMDDLCELVKFEVEKRHAGLKREVGEKIQETQARMENLVREERRARELAETAAREDKARAEEDIRNLQRELDEARKQTEVLQRNVGQKCIIL